MPLTERLFYGQIMKKNYIGFVNDHSGSMRSIRDAAIQDSNTLMKTVRDAASAEELDTVVSVVGFGFSGKRVQRQVQISNPHVLKPINSWACDGMTPMYDGIGSMIELLEGLPDANNPDVSFLLMITTDGGENDSREWGHSRLAEKIQTLQATERWTFVFRVPSSQAHISSLGVPAGNIQTWDTTTAGMEKVSAQSAQAMTTYFRGRSGGARGSSTFYSDASKVDVTALTDISSKVTLYVVPDDQMGVMIRDFILTKRMRYLKGSAFYQLTKTESKVSHTKMIAIRQRATGKIFSGAEARGMIGMPTNANARLHPGDHGEYDIFIQSESVNRKLVAGTGVLYWEEIGTEFTDEELTRHLPKTVGEIKATPAVVQLPAVKPNVIKAQPLRPTPSPIPVTKRVPKVNGLEVVIHSTRAEGRKLKNSKGRSVMVHDFEKLPLSTVVEGFKSKDRWFTYK